MAFIIEIVENNILAYLVRSVISDVTSMLIFTPYLLTDYYLGSVTKSR